MPRDNKLVENFITSSFQSVWSLELLLCLRAEPERYFSRGELLSCLRASDEVVATSVHGLRAAGLVVENEQGCARFAPASDELRQHVDAVEALYRTKPDAVRRVIVHGAATLPSAFADAFKLRGDK